MSGKRPRPEQEFGRKGGEARAKALTRKQRSEIAKRAAQARWKIPRAPHTGELCIGDAKISCAVLEDGTRLLTQEDFLAAIGRARKAKGGQGGSVVDNPPPFLAANNLSPFVTKDLIRSTKPIPFRSPKSGGRAFGYAAELLPSVCEVYLEARAAGVLTAPQLKVAHYCEILMRGLARVGIVALVDEATGYQQERSRRALAEILEKYISSDLSRWAKTFPDEFYKQLFRLRGWEYSSMNVKRPSVVGHWTNDIVYERLAPGVLDELRGKNPLDAKGQRKHRHHQWLSVDWGHPRLREHLWAVIALMKISTTWDGFKKALDAAFPKYKDWELFVGENGEFNF